MFTEPGGYAGAALPAEIWPRLLESGGSSLGAGTLNCKAARASNSKTRLFNYSKAEIWLGSCGHGINREFEIPSFSMIHNYHRSKAMHMWNLLNNFLFSSKIFCLPTHSIFLSFCIFFPKNHQGLGYFFFFTIQTLMQWIRFSARLESAPKLHQQRAGNMSENPCFYTCVVLVVSPDILKPTEISTDFPFDSRCLFRGIFLITSRVNSVKRSRFPSEGAAQLTG